MDYKLIIFDMNGTLTNTPFIDKQPLALLPGRKERCKELQKQGAALAIATNQGGVAFGYTTPDAVIEEVRGIAHTIGTIHYAIAFGHPKPKPGYEMYADPIRLRMRKPEPGMLYHLMQEVSASPQDTLMVGDLSEDEQAAKNAGVSFMWADDFFGKQVGISETTIQRDLGYVPEE